MRKLRRRRRRLRSFFKIPCNERILVRDHICLVKLSRATSREKFAKSKLKEAADFPLCSKLPTLFRTCGASRLGQFRCRSIRCGSTALFALNAAPNGAHSEFRFCSAENFLTPQADGYRFAATIIGRTVVSVMRTLCGAGIARVAATTGRFSVWT